MGNPSRGDDRRPVHQFTGSYPVRPTRDSGVVVLFTAVYGGNPAPPVHKARGQPVKDVPVGTEGEAFVYRILIVFTVQVYEILQLFALVVVIISGVERDVAELRRIRPLGSKRQFVLITGRRCRERVSELFEIPQVEVIIIGLRPFVVIQLQRLFFGHGGEVELHSGSALVMGFLIAQVDIEAVRFIAQLFCVVCIISGIKVLAGTDILLRARSFVVMGGHTEAQISPDRAAECNAVSLAELIRPLGQDLRIPFGRRFLVEPADRTCDGVTAEECALGSAGDLYTLDIEHTRCQADRGILVYAVDVERHGLIAVVFPPQA